MRHFAKTVPTVLGATLLLCGSFAQQAPSGKHDSANKNPSAKSANVGFSCPDPKAKQACDSFLELLRAKDPDLRMTASQPNGYVCFRTDRDEFFVVQFSRPVFHAKYDSELKTFTVGLFATYFGQGTAWSFKNGVQDSNTIPYLNFTGNWMPLSSESKSSYYDGPTLFTSSQINRVKEPEEVASAINIDEGQFSVNGFIYKNSLGEDVRYYLSLQRSTGRYIEKVFAGADKIPTLEREGRCVTFSPRWLQQ